MTSVVSTLRMPSSWQKPGEHHVDAGRVDVGQLGQVADAHHHLGVRVAAPHFEVAAERRGEAEADRLEDRVDAKRHAARGQRLDRARPARPASAGASGIATTSQPQSPAAAAVRFDR